MQSQSTRKKDSQQENIINGFLQKYYFDKTNNTTKQITNYELQIAGVDFQQIDKDGNIVNIDVKAQSSPAYINNPRPTFVLELSSLDRYGEPFVGWFLNPDIITDTYCFVWINSAEVQVDGRIGNIRDIHEVEIMNVPKKKLQDFVMPLLENIDLQRVIQNMRDTEQTRVFLTDGLNFSHSPHLWEKPVNLVAKKWLLKKFATSHYLVTQDSITSLLHKRG